MLLHTRRWGFPKREAVVCIHGTTHHGGIFEPLAKRLVAKEHFVVAVDLRGHGQSSHEPPWDVDTHAGDVLATMDELGIERATLVGHSLGGLVAVTLAASEEGRVQRLVLLDPAIEVSQELALRNAEIGRVDWSFRTTEGAINALLSSERIVSAPRETVAAFVESDVQRGPDGLFRFSYFPPAAVVAWSEIARPAPPVAQVPTLLVRPVSSFFDGRAQDRRYRDALGSLLTVRPVPNGHNVLWEAAAGTEQAIESFLEAGA